MGEHTEISWADSTLNIWMGCTKVSNGPKGACEGCYAQVLVEERFGRAAWGPHAERIETKGWRAQLRKISRLAKAAGRPWFVFVNSLSDFWDNQADRWLRGEALDAFAEHPHVTFLLLTKRPQNILPLFRDATTMDQQHDPLAEYWPRNVAIGCTIVTQAEADRDLPYLLRAKAALNPAFAFVSMEPLMGPVDLTELSTTHWRGAELLNGLTGELRGIFGEPGGYTAKLDWVIAGGETDQGAHKARPSHPWWFESLRDQCAAATVPFQLKQWGEWRKGDGAEAHLKELISAKPWTRVASEEPGIRPAFMVKAGKRHTGRLLDGVLHDARPSV